MADDQIAGLLTGEPAPRGPEIEVIDVDGGTVVPGFVDVHTHLDTFQVFERAYRHTLTGGKITGITETDRFGRTGIETLRAATADLSVNVFAPIPAVPYIISETNEILYIRLFQPRTIERPMLFLREL